MALNRLTLYTWHMATITLDIKSELPKAIRWTDTMTKQLPFAISQALNSTGFDIRRSLKGCIPSILQQPNHLHPERMAGGQEQQTQPCGHDFP